METFKLQDKLQEITDENCLHKFNDYDDVECIQFTQKGFNEAMIAFAAYCCERQRESDAEAADINNDSCYREGGYCLQTDVDKSAYSKTNL